MIGCIGKKVIFETSDKRILNFNNFTRTATGRWAIHELINTKAKSEFLGAGLQKVTFDINLNAELGVKPKEVIDLLFRYVEHGVSDTLIIGTRRIGNNLWKVTDISETWNVVLNKGEIVSASLSLTLEEYT